MWSRKWRKSSLSKKSCVSTKSAPASTFSFRCSQSAYLPSLQATCPSGKPATPMQKSPCSRAKRTSWLANSKPPGAMPELATARRVAAQGEQVLHPQRADLPEQLADLLARGAHAGQVGHRGQAMLRLDALDDPERLVARAAAGTVGDRAVIRARLQQRGQRLLQQIAVPLLRLGREELERISPGAHRHASPRRCLGPTAWASNMR